MSMTEIRRQFGHVAFDVNARLVPFYESFDRKRVAKVMNSWSMTVVWSPESDFA